MAESDPKKELNTLLGKQVTRAFPPKADLAALRRAQANAEAEIRFTGPAAARGGQKNPAAAALSKAEQDLSSANEQLSKFQVRPMDCYEQASLLLEALDVAESRLLITTDGLQPTLVNGEVIRQIDILLERGVSVRVEVSAHTKETSKNGVKYDPRQILSKKSFRGPPVLVEGRKRSLYFLLKDRDLAVVTNRPFFGDPFRRSGFMFVSGIVIREPEMVDKLYQKLAGSAALRNHG